MSGCHEPVKQAKDFIIELMDNFNASLKVLEKLILYNQDGLGKCLEWAEKFEQEINSIMGQIEGLSTHIEKVHDLVNLEDRITASDILNRLTLLEMSIHPDSTSKSPAIASLSERMRILEEFYNQQRNTISALETVNGENSRQLIFIQEQDKQGFSWHKGQIEALAERIKSLENQTTKDAVYNQNCFHGFLDKIKNLEEHKNYQIDENRKVSKRLDEIDKQIIETRIQFINQIGNEKRPHTCPVCNGTGELELQSIEETINNDNKRFKTCHSCEGKGVLWG